MADPVAAPADAQPPAPPAASPAATPPAPALSYPDQARAAGYSDEQINQWLAPWMADARAKGYSQDQINAHLGIVPPPAFDDDAVRSQISSNLAASAKPVTSFGDALEAGWQLGNVGMGIRGAPPSKTLSPDAPWASRIAAQTAELAGDLPSMLGGLFAGAVGGAESGPPGMAIGGTAGAMALPTALRGLMMDSYAKGQFINFRDFWSRVAPVMIDTAKSWVTGAATGAAGAAVGAAAGTVPGAIADFAVPGSMQAAKTAAEVATMTTVGAAMEGHAPAAMDFVNAAVTLGGLHFAGLGAAKLRDLYAETGITPSAVIADATRDPTIVQDLLSDKAIPDAYAAATSRPAGMSESEASGRALAAGQAAQASTVEGAAGAGETPPGETPGATPYDTATAPRKPDDAVRFLAANGGIRPDGDLLAGEGGVDSPSKAGSAGPLGPGSAGRGSAPDSSIAVPGAEGDGGGSQANLNFGVGGPPRPPGTQGLLPLPEPGAGPPATLADAQNRILAHVSIGEQPPARGWSWGGLYTNLVDRLYPLAAAVKSATSGEGLPAAQNAYKLARLMSGVAGKADRMLNGAGTFDFNSYQDTGPSLKAILAPVADDLDGFRAYLTSARAIELEGRGIATGFDLAAAQRVVAESADRYGAHAANLFDFQDRVSRYLRDSGVLSAAGYTAMREANQLYVPFQRVMDDVNGLGIKLAGGGSLQARNPIHAIQGSQRVVIDPLESIIRNTFLFTQMAERNAVGTQMADMLLRSSAAEAAAVDTPAAPTAEVDALRDAGVAHPEDLEPLIAGAAPPREGEIRIFRDGRPETYEVDADLARAMKGLDGDTMSNLERMLRPFASALRAGAVLQPDFVLRHSIRDFLYAAVTSPSGFTPIDMARGFLGLARQDADYQEWLKTGAANVSMVSLDRRYLQHSIDDLAGTGLLERAWNVVQDPNASTLTKARTVGMTLPADVARKFLISPMQAAVQFAESASHLGVFKQQLRTMEAGQEGAMPLSKAQLQEAGFVSRDTAVDASRMGAKMQTWNAVAAFSNIAIQDSDRVIRAFRDSPMSTAIKVAGAISLPSALTWWNGHGDSRYDDAPNWERDLFWVIPTDRWQDISSEDYAKQTGSGRPADQLRMVDGQYQANNGITVRIPKPWGMGLVFGSGVERTLDAFIAHKPGAYAEFAKSMGQVSLPNLAPNALVPVMEQFANRSTFTNRTLVPDEMEKWLPEYQYTPYTTQTARALGQALGAFPGIKDARLDQGGMGGVARAISSPILLENYLRAWTGNLGMYALQLADAGLRKAGVVPDPPMPASTLADIPVIKAFVVRYPSSSAQSIQDFQDQYAANKMFLDTWRAQARGGDAGAMAQISAAAPPVAQTDMSDVNASLLRMGVTPPSMDRRTMGNLSSQQMRATTDVETQSQLAGMQVAAIRAKSAGFGSQVSVAQLDDIHQAIGENSQLVRDIDKNPAIPPDEKRQLIDTAYWRMAELAQIGKAALAQAVGAPTVAASSAVH